VKEAGEKVCCLHVDRRLSTPGELEMIEKVVEKIRHLEKEVRCSEDPSWRGLQLYYSLHTKEIRSDPPMPLLSARSKVGIWICAAISTT
jgi:hypothetical protein